MAGATGRERTAQRGLMREFRRVRVSIRVCFNVPMAQPIFEPEISGPFGGSEVRAFLFATGLAARGLDVHVIVHSHRPRAARRVCGVTLHDHPLPAPLPRYRDYRGTWQAAWLLPWTTLRRGYRSVAKRLQPKVEDPLPADNIQRTIGAQADACFGVHAHAARVIRTAQAAGRPSVLFLASDTDLSESYRAGATETNAYGQSAAVCFDVLQQVTQIVAQTESQRQLLAQRFGRQSVVIRNPIPPLAKEPARTERRSCAAPRVIWVGRADCFSKRADLAIEIARRCPTAPFTLIMNRRDGRLFDELRQRASANVRVVPEVPWSRMSAYLGQADLLLNTSMAEGFPNTFLQAAQIGLPILSLHVDPEGILERGCGWCATGDLDALVARVQTFDPHAAPWTTARRVGPDLIRQQHDAAERAAELEELLRHLLCDSTLRPSVRSVAA